MRKEGRLRAFAAKRAEKLAAQQCPARDRLRLPAGTASAPISTRSPQHACGNAVLGCGEARGAAAAIASEAGGWPRLAHRKSEGHSLTHLG